MNYNRSYNHLQEKGMSRWSWYQARIGCIGGRNSRVGGLTAGNAITTLADEETKAKRREEGPKKEIKKAQRSRRQKGEVG